jgi:hypothetical protein
MKINDSTLNKIIIILILIIAIEMIDTAQCMHKVLAKLQSLAVIASL